MSSIPAFALLLLAFPALATDAPSLINYQGVLRDAADEPLTGDFDMVFRSFDAESAGNEILIDQHFASNAQAVMVDGGLFSVALGGGQIVDGSGPGTFASLADLFRDHAGVWLEVTIGAETLAPRTPIQSAPYALHATNAVSASSANLATDSSQLAGQPASFYLDSSAATQTKLGRVVFDNGAGRGTGIVAFGPRGGGYFGDSKSSAYACIGYGDYGMQSFGNIAGGYFAETGGSGWARVALGDYGIRRGAFRNVPELIRVIHQYLRENNKNPRPFIWTATAAKILRKIKHRKETLESGHQTVEAPDSTGSPRTSPREERS